MRFRWLVTIAIVVALTAPTLAHHSLVDYDQNTIVTIKGTIGEIKWQNPHAVIVVEVKNPDGSNRRIQVEMAPPNGLTRKGINTALFRVGDAVVFDVWMPKSLGRNSDYSTGRTLTLADGRKFDVGDSLMWGPANLTAPTPPR
jgi:hypothetical protein